VIAERITGTHWSGPWPLVLSRVHWVQPELVAEVKYLTWTDDNLLWQVVYEGMREDKPAAKSGGRGRIPRATRADSRTATSKNA
jgi:ATP-dependent DNA ligase